MVYGELGITPLLLHAQCSMVMFWARLHRGGETPKLSNLLFQVLLQLYKDDIFKLPWISAVKDQFLQKWSSEISLSGKCIHYRMFKTSLRLKSYLLSLSYSQRQMMATFRCRNHNLPIESGCRTAIPRNLRVCTLCDELGDEFHFVFKCSRFTDQRKQYINNVLLSLTFSYYV